MCESYSGPTKSGPIKRLTRLNSGPIKRSQLYIYICNELIEETVERRKLIFGMWESFGYGSSKF